MLSKAVNTIYNNRLKSVKRKKYILHEMKKNKISYILIAPFMILFFLFTVIPVLSSILLSFTSFNMLQFPTWIGWTNYKQLFLDDEVFKIVVKNTLIFAFLTGPLSYFLCLIFAWLINELPKKLRTLMTFVFYAPSISGNIFFIWLFMFSGDAYGLINGALIKYGFIREPVLWLADPKYNLKIIILVQLWLSLGVSFLAFMAGLQNVDKSLYEAGAIDGIKNRWQELFYITIPSMAPQLLFGAVMQIASSFAAGNVSAALAGSPSVNYSADTIVTYMNDYGTVRYEMGYAACISVVLTLSMVLTNKIIRKLLSKIS